MGRIFTLLPYLLLVLLTCSPTQAITVNEASGWIESAYVTWTPVEGAANYRVQCRQSKGEYFTLDASLVRNYGSYGRADILGLQAGEYQFRLMALDAEGNEIIGESAETALLPVRSHDRGGFAHLNHSGIGAYNDDGTLKNGAKVI